MPAAELQVVRRSPAELQEQHQENEDWLNGENGFLQEGAGRMQGGNPMVGQINENTHYHCDNKRIPLEK